MKTIAYLLIANFFIISVVNAQTTPWVQEGNGSTDPSIDFVGTTDDVDLRFRTDNTQRMCLTGTNGFYW